MPASIIELPRTSSAKCSPGESMSGGTTMEWLWVWIASIGTPAAIRPITGTITGVGHRLSPFADAAATRPRLPSMTLGEKPRVRGVWRRRRLRQPHHLDGAGAIGQAADEAALLERLDQPVDAGLGAQVERILHLVEGRRDAASLRRSLMNISSSCCLRVSIGGSRFAGSGGG